MVSGLRVKRADGTWTDKGGEQWVEPPPGMKLSSGVSLFQGWYWLTTAPLLDTSDVTLMSGMFNGCTSLTEIPLLDTSNVTNMANMFTDCTSLTAIEVDMSSISSSSTVWGTTESNALSSLTSLLTHGMTRSISVRWTAMGAPALNAWFDSLGQAASGATINITGAPGADTCDRTIATSKGWTVVG